MGAADRRLAYRDEVGKLRSSILRARRRLEEVNAHELANTGEEIDPDRAAQLYCAVRDALDILNRLPEGYWRKKATEYRSLMDIDDLGTQELSEASNKKGKR